MGWRTKDLSVCLATYRWPESLPVAFTGSSQEDRSELGASGAVWRGGLKGRAREQVEISQIILPTSGI